MKLTSRITILLAVWLLPVLLPVLVMPARAQDAAHDTIVERLHRRADHHSTIDIGSLDLQTYTYGTSHCLREGVAGKFLNRMLPFQGRESGGDVTFESFGHLQYHWPGEPYISVPSISATSLRKGRNSMRDLFKTYLPMFVTRRHGLRGSGQFLLPFFGDGFERYEYALVPVTDSLLQQVRHATGSDVPASHLCCISFDPIRGNDALLSGYALLDSVTDQLLCIKCDGSIDLATFSGHIYFDGQLSPHGIAVPSSSDIDITYHYLGTRGTNSYHTSYRFSELVPYSASMRRYTSRDLTDYYTFEPQINIDFDTLRPITLPADIDSALHQPRTIRHSQHKRKVSAAMLEAFGSALFEGQKIGSDENRLRISAPLDPASFGYDKLNGFTIRERLRWNYLFRDHERLSMLADVGYAWRLEELRFRLMSEWLFSPSRRGKLKLEFKRSNSSFSSKFIQTVNEALSRDNTSSINFDSLGIDYYKRYQFFVESSIEVANGMMLYVGLQNNYRTPVTHGVRKATEERRHELLDTHYADLAPFMRLEWTPCQYYWYRDGYKEYVHSPAPTFSFEVATAIPKVWNADSKYARMEFDMQQSLHVTRSQTFAFHFGMGQFFNQKGEYFINYRYFDRSLYPVMWEDDHIGGVFHLLDDYWYSSSPRYVQLHAMYDTPFGILHLIRPLSRFISKERLYFGGLWAEGKSFYSELGYGIYNKYFNVGGFVGMHSGGVECGVKFRVEINRHL